MLIPEILQPLMLVPKYLKKKLPHKSKKCADHSNYPDHKGLI